MSGHRDAYKQLSSNENLAGIEEAENLINQRQAYYIPEDMIAGVYGKLQSGDIVGITSTLGGQVLFTKTVQAHIFFMHL